MEDARIALNVIPIAADKLWYLVSNRVLISQTTGAQDFIVTPTSIGHDFSALDNNTKIRKPSKVPRTLYLRPEKRDSILNKYVEKDMANLDQSERDLLYKCILSYDNATLVEKYSFLKKTNIEGLRNELR